MVRCVLLMLGLLAASAQAAPSAALHQRTVALGEPVLLVVIASDADLSEVDLTPLQTDFEVFASAASRSETRGRVQSRLEVTLYPLRTGSLQVPPLRVLNQQTAPLQLTVLAGHDGTPAVDLRAWILPEYPMEREPTLLRLQVIDDGSLEWDRPASPPVADATLLPAGESLRETEIDGTRRVVREFRWRVLPLKAGSLTIPLPTLDAHKFGQRLRFAAPVVSLRPRPAPAYLPLQLPIGRPAIRSTPPVQLTVARPANWVLDIDAPGLSVDGLRSLLPTPHHPSLKFYPPVIESMRDGEQTWLRATLSFVPQESGSLALPALALPWFDAASGQLRELRIDTPPLAVRDPRWEWAMRVALALIGVLMLAGAIWLSVRQLRRWRRKRAWLQSISRAADAPTLHAALTAHAPVPSRTLSAWSHRAQATPGMVEDLERLRFGPAAPEIEWNALKAAWRAQGAQLPLRLFLS